MNEWLAVLGLKNGTLFAGGVGAAISFKFFRELAWPERIWTALLSIPLAGYGGGGITEAFELGPRAELAVTVVVGAIGIATLSAIFKNIPVWVESARKRVFGGE